MVGDLGECADGLACTGNPRGSPNSLGIIIADIPNQCKNPEEGKMLYSCFNMKVLSNTKPILYLPIHDSIL